jgi:hypothetical protein
MSLCSQSPLEVLITSVGLAMGVWGLLAGT